MLQCENKSKRNGKNIFEGAESVIFSQEKILEHLADILEYEKLISPFEKIALKEKINTYGDTL